MCRQRIGVLPIPECRCQLDQFTSSYRSQHQPRFHPLRLANELSGNNNIEAFALRALAKHCLAFSKLHILSSCVQQFRGLRRTRQKLGEWTGCLRCSARTCLRLHRSISPCIPCGFDRSNRQLPILCKRSVPLPRQPRPAPSSRCARPSSHPCCLILLSQESLLRGTIQLPSPPAERKGQVPANVTILRKRCRGDPPFRWRA